MARSFAKKGSGGSGGGALIEELRRLELMHETGALSDAAYMGAREALMQSVTDAEVLSETPPRPAAVKKPGGGAVALAAVGLGAVALIGATPELLICVCLAAVATVGFAACWEG